MRGHILTITKGSDWFEDQPDWRGEIECLSADECGGWQECREPHLIGGWSVDGGPYETSGCLACEHGPKSSFKHVPWCDEEELVLHGVVHTWRWGHGWTVPFEGCVVAVNDYVCDSVFDIGQQHGEGRHLVDDEWDDHWCALIYAGAEDQ
jgi:hypothetical protein